MFLQKSSGEEFRQLRLGNVCRTLDRLASLLAGVDDLKEIRKFPLGISEWMHREREGDCGLLALVNMFDRDVGQQFES